MFIERLSTARSASLRSLVYGHGINDATHITKYRDDTGAEKVCPYYMRWRDMLARCYCPKFHLRQPTYKDCTVEESWKTFSIFRAWMQAQTWQGKSLDKDLLQFGSKQYGPDTCLFISKAQNQLLALNGAKRGDYPLGVSLNNQNSKSTFVASCSIYGKNTHLGTFSTPEAAAEAYKQAKLAYIAELAAAESDPRIKQALLALH